MKKIIAILLMITSIHANPYDQPNEPYFNQYDKQLHIGITIAISAATYAIVEHNFDLTSTQKWWISFSTAFILVSAKEVLYDTNGDMGDVGANAIGSAIGSTGMYTIYEFQSGS